MADKFKKTEGCEDFLNHVNKPTKKDPRKSNSYEHDKAHQQLRDQSTPIKTKVKGQIKF